MSNHGFKIIRTAKVGELDETMQQEWDRLYTKKMKLEQDTQELEERFDAFVAALQDAHGKGPDTHGLNTTLRVDGTDVLAEFCPCPACQAPLHGLSVTETVELMFENNLLPKDTIKDIRKKAKAIDAQRSMLN